MDEAHNFVFDKYIVLKEPTCTERGVKQFICTVCGSGISTVTGEPKLGVIYKIPHDWDEHGICRMCGKSKDEDPDPAPEQADDVCPQCGSTNTSVVKDFVACDHNIWRYTCNACRHTWSVVHEAHLFTIVEPTCTEEGKVVGPCSLCGSMISTITGKSTPYAIPALGHDFDHHICTRCGINEQDICKHQWVDARPPKSATCTEEGREYLRCTKCELERENILEKIPHNPQWVIEDSEGVLHAKSKCSMCGEEYSDYVISGSCPCPKPEPHPHPHPEPKVVHCSACEYYVPTPTVTVEGSEYGRCRLMMKYGNNTYTHYNQDVRLPNQDYLVKPDWYCVMGR